MDAQAYPQEVLAEEEPKYLRRQKRVEIRRRKFGKNAWKTYLRVTVTVLASLAIAGALYATGHFVLTSPEMSLLHPDQVSLRGNHYVTRANVLEIFTVDRGRSVLRIPLETRRKQLEALPWVERAVVRRALPNRVEVEIVERTPVAFHREDGELALVDSHGVILDRPLEGDFHFPVATGLHAGLPADERERRMRMFSAFLQQIDAARSGSSDLVSEVDLSDAKNLQVTFSRLPDDGLSMAKSADGPLLVFFGDRDFQNRFQTLLGKMGEIKSQVGRVEMVDMRFDGEVVVNPDTDGARPKPETVAQRQDAKTKSSPPLAAQHQDAKTKSSPPLTAQQLPKRRAKRSKLG
jgi:cell division protein FtsQ